MCNNFFFAIILVIFLLQNALSVYELLMIALELPESGYQEDHDNSKENLARSATQILISKALMLNDYFSIEFDADENILSIPLLLGMYILIILMTNQLVHKKF